MALAKWPTQFLSWLSDFLDSSMVHSMSDKQIE